MSRLVSSRPYSIIYYGITFEFLYLTDLRFRPFTKSAGIWNLPGVIIATPIYYCGQELTSRPLNHWQWSPLGGSCAENNDSGSRLKVFPYPKMLLIQLYNIRPMKTIRYNRTGTSPFSALSRDLVKRCQLFVGVDGGNWREKCCRNRLV